MACSPFQRHLFLLIGCLCSFVDAAGCAFGRVPVNETANITDVDFEGPCHCEKGYEPPGYRLDGESKATSACDTYPPPDALKKLWGEDACVPCLPGYAKPIEGNYVCEKCPSGRYAESCGTDFCIMTEKGTWSGVGSATSQACPSGTYNPTVGSTSDDSCLPCPPNSQGTSQKATSLSDCQCKFEYFGAPNGTGPPLPGGAEVREPCYPCPEGGLCPGGNFPKVQPLAKPGYYDISSQIAPFLVKSYGVAKPSDLPVQTQVVIKKCFQPDACLGANQCRPGTKGLLCDTCIDGYYKAAYGLPCEECPPLFANFIMIVIVVSGVVFISFIVGLRIATAGNIPPIDATLIKIFFSYYLMTSVAFRVGDSEMPETLDWYGSAQWFSRLFKKNNLQETPQNRIMTMDCVFSLLHNSFTKEQLKSTHQFRLAMAITLPLQVVALLIVAETLMYFARKFKGSCSKAPQEDVNPVSSIDRLIKMIPYVIMIFFFVHPTLIQEYLQGILCIPIDDRFPEATFFQYDLNEPCDDSNFMWQLIVIGGLLFWCVIVPMLLSMYLRRRIFDLRQPKLMQTVGFLYVGYEEPFYYWETVVFLRKVFVVGVFMSSRSEMQKLVDLLCLGMIFLGIHVFKGPYDNRHYWLLDRLETKMLWAFIATIVMALYSRIRGLYPEPVLLDEDKTWMNPFYCELEAMKFVVIVTHLRFLAHFFWFLAYNMIFKHVACFRDGKVQYDPGITELNIASLNNASRHFVVSCIIDSMVLHIEDLKWFTFRYVESAFKEAIAEVIGVKKPKKKKRKSSVKGGGDSPGGASPGGSNSPSGDESPKKHKCMPKICRKMRKDAKRGGSIIESPAELANIDWETWVPVERLHLHIINQSQIPVDTFRKDLGRAKMKSQKNPDEIDELTGLSKRCSNVRTREDLEAEERKRNSFATRLKGMMENSAQKDEKAKAEAEQRFFKNLTGDDEFHFDKKNPTKAETKTPFNPATDELFKAIPGKDDDGPGGQLAVTNMDYIGLQIEDFNYRHGNFDANNNLLPEEQRVFPLPQDICDKVQGINKLNAEELGQALQDRPSAAAEPPPPQQDEQKAHDESDPMLAEDAGGDDDGAGVGEVKPALKPVDEEEDPMFASADPEPAEAEAPAGAEAAAPESSPRTRGLVQEAPAPEGSPREPAAAEEQVPPAKGDDAPEPEPDAAAGGEEAAKPEEESKPAPEPAAEEAAKQPETAAPPPVEDAAKSSI